MVDALRWLEILDAILDLQLLDALELLGPSPAREQIVRWLPAMRDSGVARTDRRRPRRVTARQSAILLSAVSASINRARTV